MIMFLEIMVWSLLALFLAIVVWDIAVGKPSRFYTIKKGLNTIAKVFVGLGILLGFYVCIILTPTFLRFFKENMPGSVYNLGVSDIASYFWLSLLLLGSLFLVMRLDKVNIFNLSNREIEWEKRKEEKDRREGYEAKKKFSTWKDNILSKFKLRRN
jgi:hypothetical protein